MTSRLPGRAVIRPEDRREHRRERPRSDARLHAQVGDDRIDCSVIDLSKGGAKLRFSHVPEGITEFVISHETVGELRGRCNRLRPFAEREAVEAVLEGLAAKNLAQKLPRQPGRKESRYAHLLCGAPEAPEIEETAQGERAEPAVLAVRADNERLERLETEVHRGRGEEEES